MDSILDTIKKMLGVDTADTAFDIDIIMNINSALMTLNQIGIGLTEGFLIIDNTETWTYFLGEVINLEAVKSHIFLKVKLLFDQPTNPVVLSAMERQVTELEWRLNVQVEAGLYIIVEPEGEEDYG